jgi:hypothetical protein
MFLLYNGALYGLSKRKRPAQAQLVKAFGTSGVGLDTYLFHQEPPKQGAIPASKGIDRHFEGHSQNGCYPFSCNHVIIIPENDCVVAVNRQVNSGVRRCRHNVQLPLAKRSQLLHHKLMPLVVAVSHRTERVTQDLRPQVRANPKGRKLSLTSTA